MMVVLALLALLMLPFNSLIAEQLQPSLAVVDIESSIDRLLRDAMAGEEISGEDIEAFLHWISVSKIHTTEYEHWTSSVEQIANSETQSKAAVLLAMGLAAEGNAAQSVELINRYRDNIKTSYMDNLPSETAASSQEVLASCYGWLVNNTIFSVPGAFVETYPGIFFNHTPVWGATRDAYFQVTLPKDSREWLEVFSEWRIMLSDVMNPAGVNLGSMFNLVHKTNLQAIALIEYRPELYSIYVATPDRSDWLDSWQFLGPYEKRIKARIDDLEKQLKRLLVERLTEQHYMKPEDANLIVETFTNQIKNNFFGVANSRYAADTENLVSNVSNYGWSEGILLTNRFHPKAADFQLQIIGGYLISKGEFRQLEHYINWLSGKQFGLFLERLSEQSDGYSESFIDEETGQSIAATLTGNLAAQDSNGLGIVMEWIKFDYDQWGEFNKTPAMYAAHHNNFTSYKILRNSRPKVLARTTVEGEYGTPKIFRRNVLTYALENANFEFINEVLTDVGELFVPKVDSVGRNAFFYLGLNELIDSRERKALVGRIKDLGLPLPEASFDCALAQRRLELLTCGSETFAALDRELSAVYFAVRERTEDPKGLLDGQRRWLSKAVSCVLEKGFKSCYSDRVSNLAN